MHTPEEALTLDCPLQSDTRAPAIKCNATGCAVRALQRPLVFGDPEQIAALK